MTKQTPDPTGFSGSERALRDAATAARAAPRAACGTCGTSWTGDIETCPSCQDEADHNLGLILLPRPRGCEHRSLPKVDSGKVPLGTVVRCAECGRWFRHADTYSYHWAPPSGWRPVRWWHRRALARINAWANQ